MATTTDTPRIPELQSVRVGHSPRKQRNKAVWEWKIVRRALWDAILKLNPRKMMGNPVMFVVEIGSVITTALLFRASAAFKFNLQITLWLWFTVLFANFAEAMAEGRGKAQADALRRAKAETMANRLLPGGTTETIACSKLRAGDHWRVRARDSRGRRRPLGCHRRHARALRLDQGEDHLQSR